MCRPRDRRGSVLVEFALIALVSFMLLSAVITFGMLVFQTNVAQQIADVGAQEIARMPLPASATLGLSLTSPANLDPAVTPANQEPAFLAQIYDEQFLYINPSQLNGQPLATFATTLPLINRLLVPAMIFDTELGVYRFPGAVVTNNQTGHTTVLVPIVDNQTSTITWAMPVEEVLIVDGHGNSYSQFNATPVTNPPANFVPGMVALRINLPSQSAAMSGYAQPATPGDPTIGNPISADDSALTEASPLSNYTLVVGDNDGYTDGAPGIYGGKYGLGRQLANAQQLGVRPFRKVISAQAVYRREAFQ